MTSHSTPQLPEVMQQQVPFNETDSYAQHKTVRMPPSKLAQTGALLSLASAAVHVLAAVQFSQDWWGYGAFFLVLAGCQSIYSSVLLRFPGPVVFLFGIGGNIIIILLFLSALSFGIDSVRLSSVTSSVLEISLVITLAALWWSYWVRESQPGLAGGGGNSPPGSLNPLTAYSAFNSPKSKDRWPVANLYSGLREFAIGKKREAINPIKVFSTSRNVRPILQEPITWAEHMPLHEAIFWVLRIACSLNFLFHGAWGVVGKESWIPFFGVANISVETAWMLQPWVGVMDISLGLVVLFAPTRWALLWMIVWAIWSASLRPLTGTAWWYFLERSGNYGPPLALLLYAGRGKSVMDWIMPFQTPALTRDKIDIIMWVLRVSIAIQLISHGLYGTLEGKQLLIDHFASVGLPGGLMDPEAFLITVGWIEICAGILILLKPLRAVVALVLLWEVFIGLLFPISGLPGSEHPQAFLLFRTLERFGDYAGPFGILLLMSYGPMWKKLGKSSESVTAANSGAAIGID